MASQINASNSGFGGIVSTGDSSGVLQLQTVGTTAITIDTSQNTTLAGKLTTASSGIQFSDGSTQTTAAVSPYVLKNRIINGDMVINQRNPGTVTLDTNSRFIVDRFFAEDDSTATVTGVQSTTAPAGFINSMLFTVTTADSSITASENCTIRHWIEGLNVSDLGWGTASAQTVTLSFWVRSSVTGTHSGSLLNSAANRCYVFSYTISAADTWEQKSVTIPGDTTGTWLTTNGRGIGIYWNLGSGSSFLGTAGSWGSSLLLGSTGSVQLISTLNATFYITGVQLEIGSTATSFEWLPYGTELALCQRYFVNTTQIAVMSNISTTYLSATTRLNPVPMRATPTLSMSGTWTFNPFFGSGLYTSSNTPTLQRNLNDNFIINFVVGTSTGSMGFGEVYNATLSISAEL